MNTTTQLIKAVDILRKLFPNQQVTAIQFEDGSGTKFNYQTNGGEWQFIDLTSIFN